VPQLWRTDTEQQRFILLTQAQLDALSLQFDQVTPVLMHAAIESLLDNEMLYAEGERLGLLQDDPLILDRIMQNMEFLGEDPAVENSRADNNAISVHRETDPETVEKYYHQAHDLGMIALDPLIYRQVVQMMRRRLEGQGETSMPNEQILQDFMEEQGNLFRRSARWSVSQVFFSPDSKDRRDWDDIKNQLQKTPDASQWARLGDPSKLPAQMRLLTRQQLGNRFGTQLATALPRLEAGKWHGPFTSTYGQHLIYINEFVAAQLPALNEVHQRVLSEWQRVQQENRYQQQLAHLRQRYYVHVDKHEPVRAADFANYWLKEHL
jgi:hypothetical protein